jgi:hypothetical protein
VGFVEQQAVGAADGVAGVGIGGGLVIGRSIEGGEIVEDVADADAVALRKEVIDLRGPGGDVRAEAAAAGALPAPGGCGFWSGRG